MKYNIAAATADQSHKIETEQQVSHIWINSTNYAPAPLRNEIQIEKAHKEILKKKKKKTHKIVASALVHIKRQ